MQAKIEGPPRRPFSFPRDDAAPGRWAILGFVAACGILLILATWWGGTRGWFGDRVLQSGAAALLAFVAVYLGVSRNNLRLSWQVWFTAAVVVSVPTLAWLGLSSPTLGNGAGATQLRADLALAGVADLAPPFAAEHTLWAVFPPLAILLAASIAGTRGRMWLLGLCVLLGIGEGALAISQLAGRGFGWIRWLWPGEVGVYLGTFANRNHLALLLVAMLPLCVAQAAARARDSAAPDRVLHRVLWGSAALLLFTGIVGSQSRSGLALALLATVITLVAVLDPRIRKRALLSVTAVALAWVALGGYRFLELTIGRGLDPAHANSRIMYLDHSADLSSRFGIGGIGLGNFQRLYGMHVGDAELGPLAVNHVHNDWAELVLETGWIGAIALVLLTVVFVRAGREIWRKWRLDPTAHSLVPGAAWMGASAIALHSVVDFPLRTTAVSCVFALLIATVFAGSSSASHRAAALSKSVELARRSPETA